MADEHEGMTQHSIYILIDPRTDEVRYVGITSGSPLARLKRHLKEARSGSRSHRCDWLRLLIGAGLEPSIEVIETTDDRSRECFWIAAYRDLGCDLTNCTDGGDGLVNPTEAVREKIRRSVTGNKHTEEARQKISESSKGHWTDPDYRERVVRGHVGQKRSSQTKDKMSVAHKGKRYRAGQTNSAEHNMKISLAQKGIPCPQRSSPHTNLSKALIATKKRKRDAIARVDHIFHLLNFITVHETRNRS